MITKGGVGSGITGHRTIRNSVSKLSPKAKQDVLEKLKAEQVKRSGKGTVVDAITATPSKGKTQQALEDVFGDLGMEFRVGLANSPKLKQVGEKLSKYIKLTAGNDVSADDAAKMAVAINKYAGSIDIYRKVREGKEPKISEAIESLIEKSQKFDGQIYRGMYLKDESFIKGLKPGGNVDLGGFSSWSSDKKHSLNFTDRSDAKYGVIFKMKNKSGASITHLSKDFKEKEVLVSGKSKLVVKSIVANTKGKKTLYEIEMEESFAKSIGSLLMFKEDKNSKVKDSGQQISLQDKWKIDSELFNQDQSKQIEDLIQKIIQRVKEKLQKEVLKEDYINDTIQKGGVGSGITGHRTIRDAIVGMGDKDKVDLRTRLGEELEGRNIQFPASSVPSSNPAIPYRTLKEEDLRITASRVHKGDITRDSSKADFNEGTLAVKNYTDGNFKRIKKDYEKATEKIAKGDTTFTEGEKSALILQDMLNANVLENDIVLHRGMSWNGIHLNQFKATIKKLEPGTELEFNSMCSFSASKKVATKFSNMKYYKMTMEFKDGGSKGLSVKSLSGYAEDEVLLAAGQKVKITKRTFRPPLDNKGKSNNVHYVLESVGVNKSVKDADANTIFNELFFYPLSDRKASSESKQFDDLIAKIIQRVKEKLNTKEVSKEDWIQAWKDDPHWDKREPSKLVNRLLDETDKKKVLSILELGCGNGVDSIAFGEKGHHVTGIDISPDAIKLAKKNNKYNNVTFEVGDAENLKFKDNYFDLVYSMAVLHSSNLKKSIPELARVLKPSGKSLLFLYQKTEYEYNDETEKNFAYGEIEGLFAKNNLKILSKDKTEKKDKDENGIHWHYSVVYILEKT